MNQRTLSWGLAFVYVVYAGLSDVPSLSGVALFSIEASSFAFVLLYLYHSYVNLGPRKALLFLVITTVMGYSFEYLFITTGWIGRYSYTAALAPFLGPIPLFIPFLWAALAYFCMLSSGSYVVSALLMVLLDMSFDPRFSLTLWHWESSGQYFGVPVTNFLGWYITAISIYVVFRLATRREARSSPRGIALYLAIALTNGALPDFTSGLYELGAISIALFGTAALLLYTRNSWSPRMGTRVEEKTLPTTVEGGHRSHDDNTTA